MILQIDWLRCLILNSSRFLVSYGYKQLFQQECSRKLRSFINAKDVNNLTSELDWLTNTVFHLEFELLLHNRRTHYVYKHWRWWFVSLLEATDKYAEVHEWFLLLCFRSRIRLEPKNFRSEQRWFCNLKKLSTTIN